MRPAVNDSHDPNLTSWVPKTAPDSADFPVQNLPYGRFLSATSSKPAIGVAIGDAVLDLGAAVSRRLLSGTSAEAVQACTDGWLNGLMNLPSDQLSRLRLDISHLLSGGGRSHDMVRACLHPRSEITALKPVDIRNYSDFFTSIHHARNTGQIKRPDNPLLPNFHSLPVAYHGRASTISISGTDFARPWGQYVPTGSATPVYEPTQGLDFECELGIYVGRGNRPGQRIPLREADAHVFGFSLLNDWSARDIQQWEAMPLGPFLAKSFLSTVSPWIVTSEALAPFRIPAAARAPGSPELLPHLSDECDRIFGGLDIEFEVRLLTNGMRDSGLVPSVISRPKFKDQYWTPFQMLAHHTSNGCALETGDLIGSGTVSGPTTEELGCLLEITTGGRTAICLPNGEKRLYLQDGDEVTISARCQNPEFASIGFGQCTGTVTPCTIPGI